MKNLLQKIKQKRKNSDYCNVIINNFLNKCMKNINKLTTLSCVMLSFLHNNNNNNKKNFKQKKQQQP